jgi:hypothetical protein
MKENKAKKYQPKAQIRTPHTHIQCDAGGTVDQTGPQTYRTLHFVGGSFGLHSVLLTEGSLLRDLGVTSLIITGSPIT